LLRILRITARQLAAWERAGLVAAADAYSFSDIVQIKKVRDLCQQKVRPAVIRQSLEAFKQQVAGLENPLVEAGTLPKGSRLVFRHGGKLLEPIGGQFMMDFSGEAKVLSGPIPAPPDARKGTPPEVAELFARGIALEEDPANHPAAIAVYLRVIESDPNHAAAHINLGTLYYNRQDFASAEKHYRMAIQADDRYALAYFDLGNVLDETGRVQEAIQAYRTALQLAPTYADAHYNLALAYEKTGEPRKSLPHWQSYVRLDSTGPWAIHARNQIRRILDADSLRLIYRKRG
jgi:tetratricopeptide (TPR) repeat protein